VVKERRLLIQRTFKEENNRSHLGEMSDAKVKKKSQPANQGELSESIGYERGEKQDLIKKGKIVPKMFPKEVRERKRQAASDKRF